MYVYITAMFSTNKHTMYMNYVKDGYFICNHHMKVVVLFHESGAPVHSLGGK